MLNSALLDGASTTTEANIYKKLYSSMDLQTHFVGLYGLIERGDQTALSELTADIDTLAKTPRRTFFVQNGASVPITYSYSNGTVQTEAMALAPAVGSIVNTSDATVRQLDILLNDSEAPQELRYAAARALQDIHTATAVAVLAPLLYSPDLHLRGFAVGGIACFANAVPVIDATQPESGMDLSRNGPFKTTDTLLHFTMGTAMLSQKEDFYLNFWKAWWSSNSSAVNATAPSSN